jgi:hypothetical protein
MADGGVRGPWQPASDQPDESAEATPSRAASALGAGSDRDLDRELAALQQHDLHALRVRWRKLSRSSPPEHLPRALLLRLVAYKMQARVYGDLDPETARYLTRVAKARARRLKTGETRKPKAPPPVPPVPSPSGLKPGTLIGREYHGVIHRVVVVERGYRWQDATYTSLSDIARRITGTRWNGPRFFGLRSAKEAPPSAADVERDA